KIESKYSHPSWIVKQIKNDWPLQWEAILSANNTHPPFSLRVNKNKISVKDYIAKLTDMDVTVNLLSDTDSGIRINPAVAIEKLPGFSAGEISVQDGGAQLAASLLELQTHHRVLDAAAAPGGKLCHLLEIQPKISAIIGLEKEAKRITLINENIKRL